MPEYTAGRRSAPAPSGSSRRSGVRGGDPLLPRGIERDVRLVPPPQIGVHAVSPAQSLRRGEGDGSLDDRQLPRGYGMFCVNGILFNHESRAAARPSSPARSPARSRGSRPGCRTTLPRQPRREARLGLRARVHGRDVAHAPGRRAGRLRGRHRRDALRARVPRLAAGELDLDWQSFTKIDARYSGPPRSTRSAATPSKARAKLGWAPSVSFEELVRIMVEAD